MLQVVVAVSVSTVGVARALFYVTCCSMSEFNVMRPGVTLEAAWLPYLPLCDSSQHVACGGPPWEEQVQSHRAAQQHITQYTQFSGLSRG